MLTALAQSVAEQQRKMAEGCRPRIKWSQGALQVTNLFKSVSTKPKGWFRFNANYKQWF